MPAPVWFEKLTGQSHAATQHEQSRRQKDLQKVHRFGNYDDEQASLFCVKMPFAGKDGSDRNNFEFDVAFNVIEGDLPFLLGLASVLAMQAPLNHKYLTLALTVHGKYNRLQLVLDDDHLYLPFETHTAVISNEGHSSEGNVRDGGQKYYYRGTGGRKYYSTGHAKEAKVDCCASATVDVTSFNKCPSSYTV